ncbi:MAG TPA: hypothetical protein VFS67_35515 [Polyangiaceae bacterium]|nr:hypothetical protein [Polyangiaceae bacterium]
MQRVGAKPPLALPALQVVVHEPEVFGDVDLCCSGHGAIHSRNVIEPA